MLLTTPAASEVLQVQSTAPTAVEPGQSFAVTVAITAYRPVELLGLRWEVPEGVIAVDLTADSAEPGGSLPKKLEPDVPCEVTFSFSTFRDRQTFGRVVGELRFRPPEGPEQGMAWASCIAVYPRATATDAEPLNDELRARLITAVNFDPRNGHAFLLDYVAFFSDFCNVEVPERIADIISEELGLAEEDLPADRDRYVAAVLGQAQVYGIEELVLIPEGECDASDSRLDYGAVRDVPHDFEENGDV
jgi:hypothetical protein